MKTNREFVRTEKGQSIVLIAILMMGLLALAGLAVDGGNAFLQRRNVQNAADASALAGTRVLARAICGEENAGDPEIAQAVAEFAGINGAQDVGAVQATYVNIKENVLGVVGAGSIPRGATGVAVELENNFSTHFLRVVGIGEFDVGAAATAMTGPLLGSGALRPVGVPLELVLKMKQGDGFKIDFGVCNQNPEQCQVYFTEQMQHRGWLNLAYVWNDGSYKDENPDWPRAIDPSGDADVLKEWMENGHKGPYLLSGDYVHAKPGKNSSVIGEAPEGDLILVPIFDGVPHYSEIPDPKPPPASQGGGYYYHIIGFLAFRVTGENQGDGSITGELVKAYVGTGLVGSGKFLGFGEKNACWTGTQTINLWD